jgi:hypothetical protein
LTWARKSQTLDARFAVVKGRLGTLLSTTSFATFSFIQAEKDMAFVIRLGRGCRLHGI